jgi:twitching motility protein PilT
MLADLEFSDLILISDTEAVLKGVPSFGRKLRFVPDDCRDEVDGIRQALLAEKYRDLETFRFKHGERNYRVSVTYEIEYGKATFLRRLPDVVPSIQNLCLPEHVVEWLGSEKQSKGLVIFSGPQASGKTTCAAAFVADRLARFGGHAVTYERPVEMPLSGWHGEGKHAFCLQNEFQSEEEIGPAVEQSHRLGSPDITYVGEIKGKHTSSETLRVALGSAKQLVVTTIHGFNIQSALSRLIGFASMMDGDTAASNLAQTLSAIVQLELYNDGSRKVLRVPEFLLCPFDESSKGVRAAIRDQKLGQLDIFIREQRGRTTMNFVRDSGASS